MSRAVHAWLRRGIAAVWLVSGVGFKLLGLVPRHRLIVAAVTGEAHATAVTRLVGAGEALLGLWVLSGRSPRACALVQTLAIASMNALELLLARELLLAPVPMLLGNAVLLALAWRVALQPVAGERRA